MTPDNWYFNELYEEFFEEQRLASVGRNGNRQDRETGLGPKGEHAVGKAETPKA